MPKEKNVSHGQEIQLIRLALAGSKKAMIKVISDRNHYGKKIRITDEEHQSIRHVLSSVRKILPFTIQELKISKKIDTVRKAQNVLTQGRVLIDYMVNNVKDDEQEENIASNLATLFKAKINELS